MALGYGSEFNMPVTVLRFGNIYGPGQGLNKFVPLVIAAALKGERIRLNSMGEPRRVWVYVDDACGAIVRAARRYDVHTFNIAHPVEYPNRLVASTVVEQVHSNLLNKLPAPLVGSFDLRPDGGGSKRVTMDVSAAYRAMGWRAEINLDEGIAMTVAHALKERSL
jgi:nucleoside-diphosphate-sugar epimerase